MICGIPIKARLASLILALLFGVGLGACGFQPLYSENVEGPSVQNRLRTMTFDVKGDALAQTVYSDLVTELTPLGEPPVPAYRLDVRLARVKKGVGFEEDESVTRFNFQLIATYRLVEIGNDKTLFESTSRSIAAYNVVSNQYATLTAEKDAEKRASADLAHDITLQLSLYFRRF